jgi:hypothetical protein
MRDACWARAPAFRQRWQSSRPGGCLAGSTADLREYVPKETCSVVLEPSLDRSKLARLREQCFSLGEIAAKTVHSSMSLQRTLKALG